MPMPELISAFPSDCQSRSWSRRRSYTQRPSLLRRWCVLRQWCTHHRWLPRPWRLFQRTAAQVSVMFGSRVTGRIIPPAGSGFPARGVTGRPMLCMGIITTAAFAGKTFVTSHRLPPTTAAFFCTASWGGVGDAVERVPTKQDFRKIFLRTLRPSFRKGSSQGNVG